MRSFTPPSDETEPEDAVLAPPPASQYSLHKRRSRSPSAQEERMVKKQRHDEDSDSDVEIVDDGHDSDVEIISHESATLQPAVVMPTPSLSIKPPPRLLVQPERTPRPLAAKPERHAVFPTSSQEEDLLPPPASQIPIDNFFSQRPDFRYDPSQDTMSQFQRMKREHLRPQEVRPVQQRFYDSIAEAFNVSFGTDVDSLEGWHRLCELIGCWDIPNSVEACKEIVLYHKHVNIYDLIEAERIGTPVQVFDSEKALGQYTRATTKFFPRDNAVSGGFLKFLLRRVK